MEEVKRIPLKCPYCGTIYNYKAPTSVGSYSITCINKECGQKFKFHYGVKPRQEQTSGQQEKLKQPEIPKKEIKFGWLEDGSYRLKCVNTSCGQSIKIEKDKIKTGNNPVRCPICQTINSFEKEPTEEEMLKCPTADCEGNIDKETGVCDSCGARYNIRYEDGKIVSVTKKTDPINLKQNRMKLVTGNFMGKKEYLLKDGVHYLGRWDEEYQSEFAIKDKYASKRSIRIDATFDQGGNLVYKMTVERALNPVYHNNREMAVGDIDYLNYGDTIKLGKTLIKVQKVETKKK